MNSPQTLPPLSADIRLYPFQVNWLMEQVYLLQVDTGFYEQAAFLDQRAMRQGMQGGWFEFDAVREAVAHAPARDMGLIFHIGHCGSTLISRALGLTPGLFSVREPLPFRDLAMAWAERDAPWAPRPATTLLEDLELMRALWARTPALEQTSVVKATSFCSLLAAPWLQHFEGDRAVCLAMAPDLYIATVLGAQGYVVDLVGGARPRMAGLAEATGASLAPVHELSPGEVAAMTFAAELVAMNAAAVQAPSRVLRVDFDRYLAAPGEVLQAIALHFGRPIDPATLPGLLANPVLGRYSKATDYPFSADERQRRLRESRAANRAEIDRGMAWLRTFAADHEALGAALDDFGYPTDG